MAYGQNMKAPSSGIASLMAMRGREGDNTLVHVNPMELKALNTMAPGGLTQNPATGLPEAFKLKDILPVLGGIAGTLFLGPLMGAGALAAGAGAGLGSAAGAAAAGYNREEILGTGLVSGLTAGLMGGAGAAGKEAAKASLKEGATQLGTQGAKTLAEQSAKELGQAGFREGLATKFLPEATLGEIGKSAFVEGAINPIAQRAGLEAAGGTLLKQAGAAGISALASNPDLMAMPEPAKGSKPIQSVETAQQTPQVSREEIDEFIRKGGVLPPFFSPNPNVITPGIYRSEGGQTSSNKMFSGMVEAATGDGMSDNVAFEVVGDPVIETAMLSPDEYVMDAFTVAALGNGSSDAGARELDNFREELRKKVYGEKEQPKQINAKKELSKLS